MRLLTLRFGRSGLPFLRQPATRRFGAYRGGTCTHKVGAACRRARARSRGFGLGGFRTHHSRHLSEMGMSRLGGLGATGSRSAPPWDGRWNRGGERGVSGFGQRTRTRPAFSPTHHARNRFRSAGCRNPRRTACPASTPGIVRQRRPPTTRPVGSAEERRRPTTWARPAKKDHRRTKASATVCHESLVQPGQQGIRGVIRGVVPPDPSLAGSHQRPAGPHDGDPDRAPGV